MPDPGGCETYPLLAACPFFPELRVFDAWSLGLLSGRQGCILSNVACNAVASQGPAFGKKWLKIWSQGRGVSNALALPWAMPWVQPVVRAS